MNQRKAMQMNMYRMNGMNSMCRMFLYVENQI